MPPISEPLHEFQTSRIGFPEEATKQSLVLPFLQALGYNVLTGIEPELTADIGIKQGRKG